MIANWISVCYSAMMFAEKRKKPENWETRMVYVFNYYIFFILASILSNTMIYMGIIAKDNKVLTSILFLALGIIVFRSNKRVVKKYLEKHDVSKNYVKNKFKEFASLILFFLSFFLFLAFFILSHKIQNFI